MKTFLVSCLTLCCLFVFQDVKAQKKRYQEMYVDQLESNSQLLKCNYNSTFEKIDKGVYVYKKFYPETKQITHFYTYRDKKQKIKQGLASEWWDDGSLRFKGEYNDNQRVGEWEEESYYGYQKGKYVLGIKEGLWLAKDENERLRKEDNYVGGLLEGFVVKYDTLGEISFKGRYQQGELVEQIFPKEKKPGIENDTNMVEEIPRFQGCEAIVDYEERNKCAQLKMLKFIYKNIKYPKFARQEGIQGSALVSFVIDKAGNIIAG